MADTKPSEVGIDLERLWDSANLLRGNLDAAEYKHVVLGLIFLKYIADAYHGEELSAVVLDL